MIPNKTNLIYVLSLTALTDRRYTLGDGYTGKVAATGERAATDRRYAIGDGYAGKAGATGKRAASYCDSIRSYVVYCGVGRHCSFISI